MATTKTKTVKVTIRASQRVHYLQTIEMDKADWTRLQALIKANDFGEIGRFHQTLAESYINMHDVHDADNIDGEDVEIEKAK